ncbi:nonsense-mediated mRNA decay factor SMG7 isoform X2 [Cryptomeria japonica]|uniref:nonsense-mediated mRNA decay factor SMG7 isoform X2 n=1 Tax=Cryptomeria japonica TaxID=3369 RepID=UPI0027DA3AF0|nr:nonsense-mediated mRNA decay factor SMG7 isoform X2 [Cryptomeria japonica]
MVMDLEKKLRDSIQAKTPSDPNIWSQMRENYEAIILEDHDFAEAKEIEHALWHLHYKRIEEFRARMRSAVVAAGGNNTTQGGRSVARREQVNKIRSVFKSFLSEATGFYHELNLKIKAKYGFPVDPFSQQREDYLGSTNDKTKSADLRKAQVSCHRCLIYLGDLARYKELHGEGDPSGRDFKVAESYYIQAASLWPASGNPHHQLAILATYMGNELVAVYRYFRSLAVEAPFSTARDNLILIFEKNRQHYSHVREAEVALIKQMPTKVAGRGRGRGRGDTKFAVREEKQDPAIKKIQVNIAEVNKTFRIRFVRLNGILFTRTSLETFDEVYSSAISEFEELITPGNNSEMGIGSDAWTSGSTFCGLVVLQLLSILIYTVHNVNAEAESSNLSYAEILQRSVLLQNAFTASFGFAGCIISRCLNVDDVFSCPFLPAILVFMEWLACRRDVALGNESVEEKQAKARTLFWTKCVIFLNKLLDLEKVCQDSNGGRLENEAAFTSLNRYNEEEAGGVALWEDFELRGFLPLAPAQLALDFSKQHSLSGKKERNIRVQRILAAGKAVGNLLEGSGQGMSYDADMMIFHVAGSYPEYKKKKESEAIKPKITKSMNNLDNHVQVIGPETVKQDISYIEKPVISSSVAMIVKSDSDREQEEEDEVIVFKPIVAEKHPESVALNPQQSSVTVSANSSFHDMTTAITPRELQQKSNVVSSVEIPFHISQSSAALTGAMDVLSGAYSNPQEVSKLFGGSASTVDHWSTGIGLSAPGIASSLGSWGMTGYGVPFGNNHTSLTSMVNVNNHTSLPSMVNVSQQSAQLINQSNPLWYGDREAHVLEGIINLNLHQFAGNGSMFGSELPAGMNGKVEFAPANLSMLPSQDLHSSIAHNSGISVGAVASGMSGNPLLCDPSLGTASTYSNQQKVSVELDVAKSEVLPRSEFGTLTSSTTSVTSKASSIPTVSSTVISKKGPVSRPVRHFGPPPGFGPVPSRPLDSKVDSMQRGSAASNISEKVIQKNEQPQLDDYSWLDGYTPLNKDGGRKDSLLPHSGYYSLPASDSLINAATTFPFPGRQVPNMKLCEEQQQLQYNRRSQEQSLWSEQYFGRDP